MLSALLFMVLMDKPDLDRNVAIGRNAAGDQAQRWPRRPSSNSIRGPSNWVIALTMACAASGETHSAQDHIMHTTPTLATRSGFNTVA
jgi:hypothetical protein